MERGTGTQQQQGTLLSTRLYPKCGHSHHWQDEARPRADPPGVVMGCCGWAPLNHSTEPLCNEARGPTAGMGEARSLWRYLG